LLCLIPQYSSTWHHEPTHYRIVIY
jgi:hypothetical protein